MIVAVLSSFLTTLLTVLTNPLTIPIAFIVAVFASSTFTTNATAELLGGVLAAALFYIIVEYLLPKKLG